MILKFFIGKVEHKKIKRKATQHYFILFYSILFYYLIYYLPIKKLKIKRFCDTNLIELITTDKAIIPDFFTFLSSYNIIISYDQMRYPRNGNLKKVMNY